MDETPLALEHVLVPWTQLGWPVDWSRCFGRSAPLGVELGFGNGEHLIELARARPDLNWLGVEVSWGSLQRLWSRLRREGLEHVRMVQGDGAFLLERTMAPESLSEIVINHPDPWPKKRHADRRLLSPRFARLLTRRLAPGGRVTVVTDHEAYAEEIETVLRGEPGLASVLDAPRVHALPGRTATKYERKAIEAGLRIHYFVWTRRDTRPPGDAPEPPEERIAEMPNVLLQGSITGSLFPAFTPRNVTEEHAGEVVRIQLLAVYAEPRDRAWLVETRVEEGGFLQHLMLSVEPRSEGWLLTLAPVGFPRPTWGVKRAVRFLAEELLAAHPGLRLARTTVGAGRSGQ